MHDPEFVDKLLGFPFSQGRDAVKLSMIKFAVVCLAIPVATLTIVRVIEMMG